MSPVNFLTAVVTCKKRLHHLKQTLPLLCNCKGLDVVVVDYGCPDESAKWIRQNFPGVHVVEVSDDPGFSASRARNFGAAASKTPWLVFIDADVKVNGPLLEWAEHNLDESSFYLTSFPESDLMGTFFCPKESFVKVEGYDECFRGWGGEDNDLYYRLRRIGLTEKRYSQALLSARLND
jgi:glycosyltransferase involved in cell wall biosynthesis